MPIVIPRARSSGPLSMLSKLRNSASPFNASTLVIAAVSVVLPWSTCPLVPTFTCGFVRSNFFFAMVVLLQFLVLGFELLVHPVPTRNEEPGTRNLSLRQRAGDLGRHLGVVAELLAGAGAALCHRAQVR